MNLQFTLFILGVTMFFLLQFISHTDAPCSVWSKEAYRCNSDNIGR